MSVRFSRPTLGIRRAAALVALGACSWHLIQGPPAKAQEDHEQHMRVVKRPVVVVRNSKEPVYAWSLRGRRAFLGVQAIEMTPELRQHFGVPGEAGVMIAKVSPDSPASQAGVQVGDVLARVDDVPIGSPTELVMTISRNEIGTTVGLEIWREGKAQTLPTTLAEHEGQWVDIRQFHMGDDHSGLQELSDDLLEDAIEIETETFNTAIERLNEAMSSPEWRERAFRFKEHQGNLMERIETLEQRLRELEQELERLPADD